MTSHPFDSETVMAYLDRELPSTRSEEVHEHISDCRHCQETISALRHVSSVLGNWSVADAPADSKYDKNISQAANNFIRRTSMPL